MKKIIVLHPEPEPLANNLRSVWLDNHREWKKWAAALGFEVARYSGRRPEGVEEVWVVGPPVKDPNLELAARSALEQGLVVRDLRPLGFVPPVASTGGPWHPTTVARMLSKQWVG